jgi:hypothetical protein
MGDGRVGVIISRDFRRVRLEELEFVYNIRRHVPHERYISNWK